LPADDRTERPHKAGSRRLLITAGPTHEPIDAVRYIGNRSSGTLGIGLAEAAAQQGWDVTLLLGPTPKQCEHPGINVVRFQTTADLESLLAEHFPEAHVLVMAAAVADYRPKLEDVELDGKRRRKGDGLELELEATPDLIAGCSSRRREGQTLVAFALEPREEMLESGRRKLERKGVDFVVANPLETMDSGHIEAHIVAPDDSPVGGLSTGKAITKAEFAGWLLDVIDKVSTAASVSASQNNA